MNRPLNRCVQTLYPDCTAAGVFPADVPNGEALLFPQEREAIADAAPARQRHYLAGRRAAHLLLEQAGAPSAPLLNEPDGSIRWPEGWTGSVTHAADWCAAVIARRSDCRSLGIDLEDSSRMTEPVARRILLPAELQWAAESSSNPDFLRRAALLFSAKEALYKAVSPMLKTFIGFRNAELLPRQSAEGWLLHIRFTNSEMAAAVPTESIHGRAAFCGDWCLAGVWMDP